MYPTALVKSGIDIVGCIEVRYERSFKIISQRFRYHRFLSAMPVQKDFNRVSIEIPRIAVSPVLSASGFIRVDCPTVTQLRDESFVGWFPFIGCFMEERNDFPL